MYTVLRYTYTTQHYNRKAWPFQATAKTSIPKNVTSPKALHIARWLGAPHISEASWPVQAKKSRQPGHQQCKRCSRRWGEIESPLHAPVTQFRGFFWMESESTTVDGATITSVQILCVYIYIYMRTFLWLLSPNSAITSISQSHHQCCAIFRPGTSGRETRQHIPNKDTCHKDQESPLEVLPCLPEILA